MITFSDFQNMHESNIPGRARKMQSDVIMKETWWQDIQAQTAYAYDMFHDLGDEHFILNDLHPESDINKVGIPIKFIRHVGQTYSKDPVTYWLQLQPGQGDVVEYFDEMYRKRYGNFHPVGLYWDIMDESGKYNKWLCVNTANYNQNQYPTYELLRCDYVFQWIHKGKKYECPGVLQSQNSYNSGIWTAYKTTDVEDQQKLAVPINSMTETLFYNHRMLIDSKLYNTDSEYRAWLISKVNRISPNGIARVTLTQDLYDQHRDYIEKDEYGNIVGMWADYWASEVEPLPIFLENPSIPSPIASTITVSGKPQFKIGGSAKTFTVTYYDQDGNILDLSPTGWAFKLNGNYCPDELLNYTTEGNKIKIKFLGDDSYIGSIFSISCESNDIISSPIDIEIIAL